MFNWLHYKVFKYDLANKPNNVIIEVSHIYHTYNANSISPFLALYDFSYNFQPNKIYCIIGNSGSGKSTLVQHFNGLINPDSKPYFIKINNSIVYNSKKNIKNYLKTNKIAKTDTLLINNNSCQGHYFFIKKETDKIKDSFNSFVRVNDSLIYNYSKKIKEIKKLRKGISLVFQFPEYQLFKDTIEKDIMFGPVALGVKKQVAKQDAKIFLNKLGLGDEYLQRSPFELSGGQKRRVAIAGILAIQSDIVIFDEPTVGLDPSGENEMMDIIKDLKANNKTVIVITHNMDNVLAIADEVLVMNDGKLLISGNPFDIFKNDNLIEQADLEKPYIYNIMYNLIQSNPNFSYLYDKKIRTVEELAKEINYIIKLKGRVK